jgi:uncharacterized protein YbjQ (UPF0145 family)
MKRDSGFLLSTASTLEGYRIVEQCGVVFGETVFKHGFMSKLGAGLSNFGDSLSMRSREMSGSVDLIEEARDYAYEKMIAQAKSRGANAVIAIDSDNTVGGDIMYISLYGTAVKAVSGEEYEQQAAAAKQVTASRQREATRKEAEQRQHLESLKQKRANGELDREVAFLQEIEDVDSLIRLWEIWDSYGFGAKYNDLNKELAAEKVSERMYGKLPGETFAMKKKIRAKMLGE